MSTDAAPAPSPAAPTQALLAQLPADWAGWVRFSAPLSGSRLARTHLREQVAKLDPVKDARAAGLGLFAAGECAAALPLLESCKDDLCRLLAGQARAYAGDLQGAMTAWGALTGSPSVGLRARLLRLGLLSRLGDLPALEKEAAPLKASGASAADLAYAEGLLAEAGGDHEGAAASWRVALQHDASHEEAAFRLAYRLDLEGEEDEAIDLLRGFLDRGAAPIGVIMNLGLAYEDRDEHDLAARCFRAVVEADPTNARARRCLVDAEASRRQFYDDTRERKADIHNAVLRIPVTDFELSVRARNCLQKMNLHTLGDLISRTESELLSFKNFGETSLQEVKDILALKGLRLGMIVPGRSGGLVVNEEPDAGGGEEVEEESTDVLLKGIAELDLSVRSRAALASLGIVTIGDLAQTTEDTLLACKNFGQTSLAEINAKLKELGLSLAAS